LEAALIARRPRGTRLLIVFDQFEEFVILEDRTSAEERRRFLARVRELCQNPPTGVCLLFAFRRDYMSDIIGMKIGDLIPGQSYMEIDAFKRDAARRFLEKGPNTPAPTLVDRLLTGAEALDDVPARFRPVTLNMLGLALQDFDRQVTGRPERLVQGFMEAAITQPEIRETAPKVVEKMITDANTKRPRTVVDLVADTGLRDRDVAASLLLLERRGLVRRLDAVTELWEISHDFVARQFAMLLGRLRPSPWPRVAMFASAALFALALGGAVFGIPIYVEKQASDALAELGVSVTKEYMGFQPILGIPDLHLQVARFPATTCEPTLRSALPRLIVKAVQALDLAGPQVHDAGAARARCPADAQPEKVENIEPLKGLTALQRLDMTGTNVRNLEPLKGLTALQWLDLSSTNVENLEPLKGLTALRYLSLVWTTKVENLEPLRGLTELQLLHLGNTKVENLEPLKGLTALQWLDVSGTRVRNLQPLKGLTALQHLDLGGATSVEDLEPLKGLTALQLLQLGKTNVENLEPLKGLTALQWLDVDGTRVGNLQPLKGLTALQHLDLGATSVEDLEPLKGLTALKWLHMPRVESLEPLEGLTALQDLYAEGVPEAELTRFNNYRLNKKLPPVAIH
jgi:hypothetical protein